ncbi:MAG: phosphodiester glycosidase family protein [Clostridia bacterium]|nr:phosphodiester glycosidase family protein [Clostridia bacterium]
MNLNLAAENSRRGSYTRGDLKGDILLGQYSYADVSAVIAPFLVMAKDAWADSAREMGWITQAQAAAYTESLNQLLSRFVKDMETPFEAIYDAVCGLRQETFGAETLKSVFLNKAREPDASLAPMDIDQEDSGRGLLRACRHVIFVLHDPALFAWMRADMAFAREQGAHVHIACGNADNFAFPDAAVMHALTGLDPDTVLKKGTGLDEAEGDAALGAAIEKSNACLFWYGDTGLTACRNLLLPAMVKCIPRSLVGKALTGQFSEAGRCAVLVPAHFDILPFVPLVRPTLVSYRQFDWLSRQYGEAIYRMTAEELYRRFPETFFSVYEEYQLDMPPGFHWPKDLASSEDWYGDFCAAREQVIGAYLDRLPGVRRLNGWFRLDTMEQETVPWSAQGEAKGILVHGLILDRVESADVIVTEGQTVSPRHLLRHAAEAPALQVFTNYLFFMTSRLVALHNRLRTNRPREQMFFPGGHMDYMLYSQEGQRVETFPLYKKACMGMTEEGRFVFFHFRLRGGTWTLNGQSISWAEQDVDPAKPGTVAVYTPYLSCPDQGASRLAYTKAVGEGRVNFVIHQTELICAREGDVLLPGTGVVLSMEKEAGRAFALRCGLTPAEDGYFTWKEKPRLDLRLEHPADVDPDIWARMKWAYGGGLTLAQDGECVFTRDGNAAAALALEGWASPLSSQTQESDIAALVRHPRTAIGLTKAGQLFLLVFSGRSSISAGADYIEMCEIAKKLAPDLKDMINVDGGASSVLGLGVGRRFIEYSRPSSSFDSLAGMVRPINSVFRVILKK